MAMVPWSVSAALAPAALSPVPRDPVGASGSSAGVVTNG